MKRRELLKNLLPILSIPLIIEGRERGRIFEIKPNKKYEVFLDPSCIDIDQYSHNSNLPEGTPINSVRIYRDQKIDDVIKIFEIS